MNKGAGGGTDPYVLWNPNNHPHAICNWGWSLQGTHLEIVGHLDGIIGLINPNYGTIQTMMESEELILFVQIESLLAITYF